MVLTRERSSSSMPLCDAKLALMWRSIAEGIKKFIQFQKGTKVDQQKQRTMTV